MLSKYIKDASDNFFTNVLGLEINECKTHQFKNMLCSKISIYKNDEIFDFIFLFKKRTANLICEPLLFEENPDDDTITDVLKESANLIAGTAKTMLEEYDKKSSYTLSTPEYLGIIKDTGSLNAGELIPMKVKDNCFVVAIEEN